ncbi:MAG: Ig-like domain-containing protein [Candidatus Poribacteria bacterium]|nr:Ig-like domain-containing protein [Candidatus Poribacteria bacterium]
MGFPTLTDVTPPNGTAVPAGSRILLTFDHDPCAVTAESMNVDGKTLPAYGEGNTRIVQALTPDFVVQWEGGSTTLGFPFIDDATGDVFPGLAIKWSSPSDGTTNVSRRLYSNQGIKLEFTELIASANVQLLEGTDNLEWTDVTGGNDPYGFNDVSVSVRLLPNPNQPLRPNTTYFVVGSVVSIDDESMAVSISFRTGG